MHPLLTLETYNDQNGTVVQTDFLDLHTDTANDTIYIFCKDRQVSPTGSWERNLTMSAVNETLIPIVNASTGVQKLDEGGNPRFIGEYDMWIALLWNSHSISLKDAITTAILKRKGLYTQPVVLPEA